MTPRLSSACFALLLSSMAASAQENSKNVVRYHASIDTVKYVYGATTPVARLPPGGALALVKGDNLLTGPFHVEGAEPGDTIAVEFLSLDVNSNQGIGAFAPGFGAISSTNYTPVLNPPIPERIYFYPIDRAAGTATFQAQDSKFSVKMPIHNFLGCIGVAPAGGEARSSIVPAEFGGNMDAPEVSVGNILYLPVNAPGALLYIGDGHAVMGDGEVAGTAVKVPLRVRLRVGVIKGKKIDWPRFENQDEIMATGIYRPLDDSLRIAFTQLVAWIHSDYGLSELDAYELLSKVAKIHLTEMVNPNYLVIAKIEKKYLPPRIQ
jgi:amidase